MRTVVWISGASSGIGAALADSVPYDRARVIGISRRPPARGEHVEADLSRPAAWPGIAAHFEEVLGPGEFAEAVFVHMAGAGAPRAGGRRRARGLHGRGAAELRLRAGAGKAFLEACMHSGTEATLVLCSSPAAAAPAYGASHYGAGKSALEYWAAAAATEVGGWGRVFSVVPFAVDTPMVRATIAST